MMLGPLIPIVFNGISLLFTVAADFFDCYSTRLNRPNFPISPSHIVSLCDGLPCYSSLL